MNELYTEEERREAIINDQPGKISFNSVDRPNDANLDPSHRIDTIGAINVYANSSNI